MKHQHVYYDNVIPAKKSKTASLLLFTLLALLFWLPIPLGSNRPWAWSILEIVSFLLSVGVICHFSISELTSRLKSYWFLLLVLCVFQLWQFVQLIDLPPQVILNLSPSTYHIKMNHTDVSLSNLWFSLALDHQQAKIAALKSLSYLSICFVSLVLIDSHSKLKLLMYTMVASGTFQAFYGSLHALSGNEYTWFWQFSNSSIASGSFIYRNHFANFLMLCLAVGIGLMVANFSNSLRKRNQTKAIAWVSSLTSGKAALRISLAIMVIALVLSRSRMGNTAFFASVTLIGILGFYILKHQRKSLGIFLISMFIIDTFILGAYFGIDKVQQRIEQTSFAKESRDEVNEYSLNLIQKFPITGVGGGSFYSSFQSVQGDDVGVYFDHAHNDYVQFSVEYGLPATIGLGMLVLLSLYYAIDAMRVRRSRLMQGLGFACSMSIVGMLMHISVDFQLQSPANSVYFLILLCLAWVSRFGLKIKRFI